MLDHKACIPYLSEETESASFIINLNSRVSTFAPLK